MTPWPALADRQGGSHRGSTSLADKFLDLDALVKLLGPSPDRAIINARFRRYVLERSLIDKLRTPPKIWRECFDEIGPDEFPQWWPIRYYLDQAQEWSRRFYMPQFRRGAFLTVFRDLIPAEFREAETQSKSDVARKQGRPSHMPPIIAEAKRRIRKREVMPTRLGCSRFARELWAWAGKPGSWHTIRIEVGPIWKAALKLQKKK